MGVSMRAEGVDTEKGWIAWITSGGAKDLSIMKSTRHCVSMWGQCGATIVVKFSCRLSTLLTSKLATESTWKGERGRGTLPKLQLKRVGRHTPNKGSRQLACPPCLFQTRCSRHNLCQLMKRKPLQRPLHGYKVRCPRV